jgi:hypothetical protein
MNPQTKQLMEFWNTLKEKAVISFKDINELELLLSKIFQRVEELSESRDRWRENAELSESMLKEERLKFKGLNKKISDFGGKKR